MPTSSAFDSYIERIERLLSRIMIIVLAVCALVALLSELSWSDAGRPLTVFVGVVVFAAAVLIGAAGNILFYIGRPLRQGVSFWGRVLVYLIWASALAAAGIYFLFNIGGLVPWGTICLALCLSLMIVGNFADN